MVNNDRFFPDGDSGLGNPQLAGFVSEMMCQLHPTRIDAQFWPEMVSFKPSPSKRSVAQLVCCNTVHRNTTTSSVPLMLLTPHFSGILVLSCVY